MMIRSRNSNMKSCRRIVLLPVVAACTLGWTQGLGAQPKPTEEVVIAWPFTIAPAWFDPAETPAQITPFAMLYVLHLNIPSIQQLEGLALALAGTAAITAAAIFADGMALPLFRLRGLYFAIGTLLLIFLLRVLALNLDMLTGGCYGLYVPPSFFLSTFTGYYLALLLAVMSVGLNFYLSRSRLGIAFRCIKEDEEAASSIDLKPMPYKTAAMVLSSVPTAAGVLCALNSGFIDPMIALGVERSLLPLLMALLGGTGTVWGPVCGVVIIRLLETVFFHYLALPVPSTFFFGVTLMAVALFIPEGLLSSPRIRPWKRD
jgi:branched-chain amino acid transport system permease protein